MSPSDASTDPIARQVLAARRRILADFRRLTGGSAVRDPDRGVLIACSGGADSSALTLALAASPIPTTIAYISHDMRPADDTAADRQAVADLADRLSRPFVHASIKPAAEPGNAEANARRLRYGALDLLGRDAGLPFIATGHHAEDQLETVLMRLVRGAGPKGLSGIAPIRRTTGCLPIVRPMLRIQRTQAESICAHKNYTWRTDTTNHDLSRLRAALRARVIPELLSIAPQASLKAGEAAGIQSQIAALMDVNAERLLNKAKLTETEFDRRVLADAAPVTLAHALRSAAERLTPGSDARPTATLERIAQAICDGVGGRRTFPFGGLRLTIDGPRVSLKIDRQEIDSHG